MSALVFDIETVGEKFDELDAVSQESLTRWINKTADSDEEYKSQLEDIKNELGFSPLTGQIVAIGALDSQTEKGAVYFQNLETDSQESEEQGIKYKPRTEKAMLEQFWTLAENYKEFVSFNGRSFDVPFLMVRSAVHGIRPSVDLMSNRYLTSQKFGAKHIDLLDQLTFYGAMRKRGSLHLWTRAFGITSPKASGVGGDDVAGLFTSGDYLTIAKYNAGDLIATNKLFNIWQKFLAF